MKIAMLGTGLMGYPMCEKLVEAGYDVIVYNRTRKKVEPLSELGIEIADSAAGAVREADCVLLMLSDANAIFDMLFGNANSISFNDKTIIQMGTILPQESREFQQKIEVKGGEYLEAPVLGSTPDVREKRLILMIGATQAQFHHWEKLLRTFGSDLYWIGPVGQAAAVKLALNQLIVSETAAFSLSLGMVLKSGADPEMFMSILRRSALYAPTFDKKYHRMLERNFKNPNFPTRHLLKDLDLIIADAQTLGLSTAILKAAREQIVLAIESGFADEDYSAIYNAIHPGTVKK